MEWHTVFIIWALDSRFPSTYSLRHEEDLEEELRLMYVAATRAKENLFISYPINNKKGYLSFDGSKLNSGIYFYKIINNFMKTTKSSLKKMILIK